MLYAFRISFKSFVRSDIFFSCYLFIDLYIYIYVIDGELIVYRLHPLGWIVSKYEIKKKSIKIRNYIVVIVIQKCNKMIFFNNIYNVFHYYTNGCITVSLSSSACHSLKHRYNTILKQKKPLKSISCKRNKNKSYVTAPSFIDRCQPGQSQ